MKGSRKKDPRIDAYIAAAASFAQPILKHLRKLVHRGCPEVIETVKWNMPFFEHHGMMCHMAAFKAHCAFGFWKQRLIFPENAKASEAMGNFGALKSRSDLPNDETLVAYVREAAKANERGEKSPPRKSAPKQPLALPDDLRAALTKNKKAQRTFEKFSPSHRREYIEWISGAKRAETRQRRLQKALAWMAEGKPQNWKHMS